MVKVGCLHRLEGVIYHYESVSVPPMPPEVPTRNPVVPVCHMAQVCNGRLVCFTLHVMAQRLWVKFKTVIAVCRLPM